MLRSKIDEIQGRTQTPERGGRYPGRRQNLLHNDLVSIGGSALQILAREIQGRSQAGRPNHVVLTESDEPVESNLLVQLQNVTLQYSIVHRVAIVLDPSATEPGDYRRTVRRKRLLAQKKVEPMHPGIHPPKERVMGRCIRSQNRNVHFGMASGKFDLSSHETAIACRDRLKSRRGVAGTRSWPCKSDRMSGVVINVEAMAIITSMVNML